MAGILDFLLAILDLQVTKILPTIIRVNWPSGSREEVQNRFLRGGLGGHHGFPIGRILVIFYQQVTPKCPTKFQVIWLFISEKAKK